MEKRGGEIEKNPCFDTCIMYGACPFWLRQGRKTSRSSSFTVQTADELIQEVEQKEKEESMSRAAQAFGQTAGTYLCSSPEIDSEYWPMLELGVEGKAVFRANLLTGMGELTGNYLVDGDTVQISVETVSFTGFTGENVQDMVFRIVSDSILELSYTTPDVPIGLTNPGDRFVKSTEEAASGTGGGSAQG